MAMVVGVRALVKSYEQRGQVTTALERTLAKVRADLPAAGSSLPVEVALPGSALLTTHAARGWGRLLFRDFELAAAVEVSAITLTTFAAQRGHRVTSMPVSSRRRCYHSCVTSAEGTFSGRRIW